MGDLCATNEVTRLRLDVRLEFGRGARPLSGKLFGDDG